MKRQEAIQLSYKHRDYLHDLIRNETSERILEACKQGLTCVYITHDGLWSYTQSGAIRISTKIAEYFRNLGYDVQEDIYELGSRVVTISWHFKDEGA